MTESHTLGGKAGARLTSSPGLRRPSHGLMTAPGVLPGVRQRGSVHWESRCHRFRFLAPMTESRKETRCQPKVTLATLLVLRMGTLRQGGGSDKTLELVGAELDPCHTEAPPSPWKPGPH